jgi:sterol desaturase/sphingolipid hydroxylase (fatty acid hydroxylase superfamily)
MSWKRRLYRFRSFWLFPLIGILLLAVTWRAEPDRAFTEFLWLFPIGVLIWSLIEYGLHRFLFHIPVQFRSRIIRRMLNGSHLDHHAFPRDPDRILVKSFYGLAVSAFLFGGAFIALGNLYSSASILTGIWAGFLYYEAVHYRVHISTANSVVLTRQRRAHFYHHFTNNSRCFGVTTPLWDYVFRTQR